MFYFFKLHKGNIKLYHFLENTRSAEGLDSISKDHSNQSSNFRFGNGEFHVNLR